MRKELLPHLETFAKAAELSSFTAAARVLGMSQPAVSLHVQALERSLESPLFNRQGGHILLTEAGQCLYGYAQQILNLHEEARRKITGRKEKLAGELFLAASSIPGEHHLPALLARFRQQQPHIQIRVTISDSAAVLALVEQGKAQLGLVGKKSPNPALDYRGFARDRMVLVVPAEHPWARRKQVALPQLLETPLIVREAGSGSRECFEQALVRAGKSLADCQIALELGSNEAIKEMVLRGEGLAVLSNQAVDREVKAGKLRALKIADLALEREMYVVWDKRRVLSLPAQLFLDFLQAAPEMGH